MSRRKKALTSLDIEPHNPTGRQVMIKWIVWLIVWTAIAFLIFVMLILVAWVISWALNAGDSGATISPLLPVILLIIAFIGTFIGNLILAGVFNLVYTTKYYDMRKMFTISLLLNILLFIFFIPLYFIFAGQVTVLFLVLWLHILLTIYLCYSGIEITTNPNYAASSMIGSAWGFAVAVFIFAMMYKILNTNVGSQVNILMSLPPVLGYLFIPLFQSIREKLYYKFYSLWNNFLYIPSLNEVMVDAEDNSEINIDL